MNNQPNRKPLYFALIFSLLVHVVFFWLLFSQNLLAYILRKPEVLPETAPIVLELEQPQQPEQPVQQPPQPEEKQAAAEDQQQLPEKYFRLEENPNANEQTPEDADILAAQSSVSASPKELDVQNEAIKPPVENPEPTIKELENKEDQSAIPDKGLTFEEKNGDVIYYQSREFARHLLTNEPEQQKETQIDLSQSSSKDVPPELKDFKGDLIGDVALSTYEWPWAPWVLQLKYAFYQHLFVPRAYSMGLIEGYTEVYLKIRRDGTLAEHRLIQTAGHNTLKESTLNAFLSSAPWKALPEEFPDEFLELRVRVIYPNLKDFFARQRQAQSQ